ncbi:RraA family protein [Novosphingobium flavum]|uniref:RraA family protein n=1 Tax=Novosphingobium flavum TaxID=1778672 RepID=A0A7X1FRX2_9SPHN|nr:RraA family protein [Novosphingobium flavum]MBC2665853.1 RraA family protein [Novosphingobium flavum]
MTNRPLLTSLTAGAALALAAATPAQAQSAAKPAAEPTVAAPVAAADPLVTAFALLETGSIADAIEQLYGIKTYMSHQMRPVQQEKMAGRAVTVFFKKEENKDGSAAIGGMINVLDTAPAGSVFVLGMEDGLDYGAIGGMMTTTMKSRGLAGAISGGGLRDLGQIRKLGFPVWGASIVPSTTVGHYRFAGSNIPVSVGGVTVNAGDIIVADADGIVVVPADKAAAILPKAQENDFVEHATLPYIEKYKSLKKAVDTFGRI